MAGIVSSGYERENLLFDNRLQTTFYGPYLIGHSLVPDNLQPENVVYARQGIAIGKGQFGQVYLERLQNESACAPSIRAVKEINKVFSEQHNVDWRREVEALILLSASSHADCFVRFHGWYDNQETVFLTQEYFPLGDLSRYIREIQHEDDIRAVTKQLADGLAAMHGMHLVHRDLKPSNVFVATTSPFWHVKIADFGCAKHNEGTGLWTTTGTSGYMAPEYADFMRDSSTFPEPTPAVDLWSLGCVIFELFVKEYPFKDQFRAFKSYCEDPVLPDAITRGIASPEAQRAIARFLDPVAASRITAGEAQSLLWLQNLPTYIEETQTTTNNLDMPSIQFSHERSDPEPPTFQPPLHQMSSEISLASTATLVNGPSTSDLRHPSLSYSNAPKDTSGFNTPRQPSPAPNGRRPSAPLPDTMSNAYGSQLLSPRLPPRRTTSPLPGVVGTMNTPRSISPAPPPRQPQMQSSMSPIDNGNTSLRPPTLPPRRPSPSAPSPSANSTVFPERPPVLPSRPSIASQRRVVDSNPPPYTNSASEEWSDTTNFEYPPPPSVPRPRLNSNNVSTSYHSPTIEEEVGPNGTWPPESFSQMSPVAQSTHRTINEQEETYFGASFSSADTSTPVHEIFSPPLQSTQLSQVTTPLTPMTTNESTPDVLWQQDKVTGMEEGNQKPFKCHFRQQELLFGFEDLPCQLDNPPWCDLCEERERMVGPRGNPAAQKQLFDCETCGKGRLLCEQCAREAINRPGDPHQADHILRQVGPAWTFQFPNFMFERRPSPEVINRSIPPNFVQNWVSSDYSFRSPPTNPPCKFMRVIYRFNMPPGTYQLAAHVRVTFDASKISSDSLGAYQKKMMKLSKSAYGYISFGAELVPRETQTLGEHTRYMPEKQIQKHILRESGRDDFSMSLALPPSITVSQGQALEVTIRTSYDQSTFKQGCPFWWNLNYIGLSQFGQKAQLASRGQIIRRENHVEQQAELERRATRERNLNYAMKGLSVGTAVGGLYHVVEGIGANRAKKRNNQWAQYNNMVQARNGLYSGDVASEAASAYGGSTNDILAQQQYDAGLAGSRTHAQDHGSSASSAVGVEQWVSTQANQGMTFEAVEYASIGENGTSATYAMYTRM